MEIGTAYRLRTPKTGLGRVVGEVSSVSVNLKANSFKRKSVDGYIIKLSEEDLGKFKEDYPNVKRIELLP